jgi:hypothetical protein
MSSPIIGKTNGQASSEYKLGNKIVNLVTAMAGVAIAAGAITPEHATQITEVVVGASSIIAGIWALYAASRGIIKSIIAWHEAGTTDEE